MEYTNYYNLIFFGSLFFDDKNLNKAMITNNSVEGFTVKKTMIRQTPHEIYDEFYCKLYDKLFGSNMRVEYEFMSTESKYIQNCKMDKIHILDVGCGTGHLLRIARRKKYEVDGMDNSKIMLKHAAEIAPGTRLIHGDYHNQAKFPEEKYSHVYCLFFTIYYSNDLDKVFKNLNWTLKPKGFLFLHIVDRDRFDPVLEAATRLIPFYDPQKHAKVRKTDTTITFNNLKYNSTWDFSSKRDVQFKEKFILNDGRIMQNIHHFNIPSEKEVLKLANNNGFKLVKIVDLTIANHKYNYIYCLKKKKGKN